MILEDRTIDIANRLLNFWQVIAGNLGFQSLVLDPFMVGQPAYPCNPRAELPRGKLRVITPNYQRGRNLGCKGQEAQGDWILAFYIQLLQTPGENHQLKALEAMKPFNDSILQEGFSASVFGVPGLTMSVISPLQNVIFDQQEHRFRDPSLRVSLVELTLNISGVLQAV